MCPVFVALLLVGLIASFLHWIDVDDPLMIAVAGAVGLGVAWGVRRRSQHPFRQQLAAALALAGQGALAGGLGVDAKSIWLAAFCWGVITLGIAPAIKDRGHEFVSVLVGYGLIVGAFYSDNIGFGSLNLMVPLGGSLALFWLWRPGRFWSGQAGACALLIALGLHSCWEPLTLRHHDWMPASVVPGWWQQGAWVAKMALAGMSGFCLWDQRGNLGLARGLVLLMLAIFLAAILPPAGAAGLLMLAAGSALAAPVLVVIGVVFDLYALGQFYYDLEMTLLDKSMLLIGAGVGLGLVWAWLRRHAVTAVVEPVVRPVTKGWSFALIIVAVLGTFAVVGPEIVTREALRTDGAVVLLPLRPVDPRSLMQGDYMQLGFDPVALPPDSDGRKGHQIIVIQLDDKGVGRFSRFADQSPLKPDERLLPIQVRHGVAQFPFTSFFFEEGQAVVSVYGHGISAICGRRCLRSAVRVKSRSAKRILRAATWSGEKHF